MTHLRQFDTGVTSETPSVGEGDVRAGWKVLTHDWRSPLQGDLPLVNGPTIFPITLPTVQLDTGPAECAAGWNYVAEIPTGWQIAGMWPTGWPVRVVAVEATRDAIQRGNKRRASSLTLLREVTADELQAAFHRFSRPFGIHQNRMAQEQSTWYQALSRPHQNVEEVEAQLTLALSIRGLAWRLQRFDIARDAWDAWAARDARDASDAWDAWAARATRDARDAWDAWAARATRDAWDAWAARAAWDAKDTWDAWAARAAWDAWAARDARAALMTLYTRLMGWQDGDPNKYTAGIREAYRQGLAVALSTGPATLGWAMSQRTNNGPYAPI